MLGLQTRLVGPRLGATATTTTPWYEPPCTTDFPPFHTLQSLVVQGSCRVAGGGYTGGKEVRSLSLPRPLSDTENKENKNPFVGRGGEVLNPSTTRSVGDLDPGRSVVAGDHDASSRAPLLNVTQCVRASTGCSGRTV